VVSHKEYFFLFSHKGEKNIYVIVEQERAAELVQSNMQLDSQLAAARREQQRLNTQMATIAVRDSIIRKTIRHVQFQQETIELLRSELAHANEHIRNMEPKKKKKKKMVRVNLFDSGHLRYDSPK